MKCNTDSTKVILNTHPFKVEECRLTKNGEPLSHPYYRLFCPDWVNILPVTKDGRFIMIRQYRVGLNAITLETPGGVIDAGEEPIKTASRELEEETGYVSSKIISLGKFATNPAVQNNYLHTFLALDCYLNPARKNFPDDEEDITVELTTREKLNQYTQNGTFNHALAVLSTTLGLKYLDQQS
jgi:ADP-ribose pyrophosphatase